MACSLSFGSFACIEMCYFINGKQAHTKRQRLSVGAHVYFQVGSPDFVPNDYMDCSCISLQSQTLAVVVVFLLLIS